MEVVLLCDMWLVVSIDFIGRSNGEAFCQKVHETFDA